MSSDPPRFGSTGQLPRLNLDDDYEATNIARPATPAPTAAQARNRACLLVVSAQGVGSVGQMHRLPPGETIIGRGSAATLRIIDESISRKHVRIFEMAGDLVMEDLGSANGTLVNGNKITRHKLRDGDKIQIGSGTIMKFTYQDALDEQFQQKMYDAALRDGLTRAFNRRYFIDRLESELAYARRHSTPLSVIILDVDHFKAINDTHGHLGGDAVLSRLSDVISPVIRAEDVFARYGGEEFGIICRGVPVELASRFAERIRKLVETTPFHYEGANISVTMSLGVANLSPEHGVSGDLIAAADAALYEAKRTGRNRVVSVG